MSLLTRENSPVRVIDLYCRISQDYDGDGGFRSVDSQEDDGRDEIAERALDGWQVGRVFKDPAKSAWNPKVVRPQWEELMTRLESGRSHGVWVYDLTRFTRKPMEGQRLVDLAERGIIVASGDSTFDLTTADGLKAFRDALSQAEYESNKIRERSTRGKRKKAQRGRSNASWRGFATPGYQLRPDGWMPGDPRESVPEERVALERRAVREVVTRLLAGQTLESATRFLNEAEGIYTVTGKLWTTQAMRQMLRRPSLAGLVEYKGDIIEGRALPFEAALDRETWEAVCTMFDARRQGATPRIYLLSGSMHCGLCGAVMYGRPLTHCKPYPDGESKRQYWCQKRAHNVGCGRLAIDQRYADALVAEAAIDVLRDPHHIEAITRRDAKVRDRRDALLADIGAAEEMGIALASKLGSDPRWTMDRYEAAARPLDVRLTRLRVELATLDEPAGEDAPAIFSRADWGALNLLAQRRLIKRAFPALTLLPAKQHGLWANTADRFDWGGEALAAVGGPRDLSADRPGKPRSG